MLNIGDTVKFKSFEDLPVSFMCNETVLKIAENQERTFTVTKRRYTFLGNTIYCLDFLNDFWVYESWLNVVTKEETDKEKLDNDFVALLF